MGSVEGFWAKYDPYEEQEPLRFDLRGYAAYVKAHGLTAADITPEVLAAFSGQKEQQQRRAQPGEHASAVSAPDEG